MFFKALGAFLLLPGIVSGAIPTLIIILDPWLMKRWDNGLIFFALGVVILLKSAWDFYAFGKGTLVHWSPPRQLVHVGLYRYVRNPMYIGVLMLVGGLAAYFGSLLLLVYDILLAIVFHLHIVRREEPWLRGQFHEQWNVYANHVNRWIPRFH